MQQTMLRIHWLPLTFFLWTASSGFPRTSHAFISHPPPGIASPTSVGPYSRPGSSATPLWGRGRLCPLFAEESSPTPADDGDGGGEPRLILGADELKRSLEDLKSKYPTSEAAWVAASKKRAEEAKKKLAEEAVEGKSGEESSTSGDAESGSINNYGPGDLSNYKGFTDDGFEASAGNDDEMAPLMSVGKEEEDEEEPTLLLFNDDDGDEEPKLLI